MRSLTFLIKPASGLCNMRCAYCFYEDVAKHRGVRNRGLMSEDTARALLRAGAAYLGDGGHMHIVFQGGEPTLAGLDFYRRFLEAEKELCPLGIQIHHGIQTNGLALDDQWASFFGGNNFLVGLSVDGTAELHNRLRPDAAGKGTWNRACHGLSLLKRHNAEGNLLCVVTGAAARMPQRIYASLKKLGDYPLQFIPCLDPLAAGRGSLPHSLHPAAYGDFLCGLYDAWMRDLANGHLVSIRYFDDLLSILCGLPPTSCANAGRCGSYLTVEGDGSLYPCDFYVLDEWYMGNIHTCSVEEALDSPNGRRFRTQGDARPALCGTCRYVALCRGGCKRDWTSGPAGMQNYYCEAFQRFFDHALPGLRRAAAFLASQRR